jgi:site-specific recombinase XerD
MPSVKATSSPLLEAWRDLEQIESSLGVKRGDFFLLRPDGSPDRNVLAYFNSHSFRRLAADSQSSYSADLKVFLSHLERQGVDWRDATSEDILNYEHWRRRDENNPSRVQGAKFARELAALRRFFEWQLKSGTISVSPVSVVAVRRRDGTTGFRTGLQPTNVRSTRVKWLTSRAYRRWRDVGLNGYLANETRDPTWRGRNDGRNIAMADTLWSSGLRLREGGTLLLPELPSPKGSERYLRGEIQQAVAKGRSREFWIARTALQSIDSYILTTRREAIRRAQAEARYDAIEGLVIVTQFRNRGVIDFRDARGLSGKVPLESLDADDRTKLMIEGPEGLEPLMLWLTESGMPMPYRTWEAVFSVANTRCANLSVDIHCYPHMLRHSFALRMLATLLYAFDRRMGLTPEERREYRLIFGDPWVMVQTMLGHANITTTKSCYLEPVGGIQVEMFLNGETDDDASVNGLLRRIAASSPRVKDIPEDAG